LLQSFYHFPSFPAQPAIPLGGSVQNVLFVEANESTEVAFLAQPITTSSLSFSIRPGKSADLSAAEIEGVMTRFFLLFFVAFLLAGCATKRPLPCRQCTTASCDMKGGAAGKDREILLANHVSLADERKTDEGQKNGDVKDGNGKKNGNGKNGNGDDDAPKHMRDHGFLVEEASNQEKGEIQHIFNWINLWTRNHEGRARDFAAAYILEMPLGSQKHQFSFITQFLTAFDQPTGRPGEQVGDVGDTFLNYRYQLLSDDDFLWCAPRFSVILPTGDKRLGLGTGEVGYQFNLPISKYGERFDFHVNAGYTFIPDVSVPIETASAFLSPEHDLRGYNFGASAFWKPQTYLHFFLETLLLRFHEIDDRGQRDQVTQVFVNPGVRYAIIQDPLEWVVGVSVPVGLTRDTPDIGVFAYMSIEFSVRKEK
jgi:hypothetical protein